MALTIHGTLSFCELRPSYDEPLLFGFLDVAVGSVEEQVILPEIMHPKRLLRDGQGVHTHGTERVALWACRVRCWYWDGDSGE